VVADVLGARRTGRPLADLRALDADLPWIVLTPDVLEAALSRPLPRHFLPSHVGFFPDARGHRIRREAGIASTIFKYCIRGTGWCELRDKHFEVGPGDLLVVPRGQQHAYGASPDRPWTIHWFHARLVAVDPAVHRRERPRLVVLGVSA
jgi:hypothetical protein